MIAPTPEDEAALDATKAPLMEHLIELRKRLIWSGIFFFIAFGVAFFFAKDVFHFLQLPLQHQTGKTMIFTALGEPFFAYIKIGMFGGLCLAFPFIAAQIWMFIAPGLYRHERNAFLPFLIATPICFGVGGAFAYYVLLPYAIHFFAGFQTADMELMPKVNEYLDLVTKIILAFGLTFQLPVLLSLLGKVGILTSQQLRNSRRFAIVGITALAAVVTPPDMGISMLALAVPLVGLYEISILLVAMFERKRLRAEAGRAAKEGAESASTDVAGS
ncbi:MAG TPA: twin-arginine translocase subunit TatC [Rhizomicrobium sp.]|nr:twin-arginine translocase subunit TatC [Rhizomicrobium sp.]